MRIYRKGAERGSLFHRCPGDSADGIFFFPIGIKTVHAGLTIHRTATTKEFLYLSQTYLI